MKSCKALHQVTFSKYVATFCKMLTKMTKNVGKNVVTYLKNVAIVVMFWWAETRNLRWV
jgi:hypothetical protein